MSVVERKGEGRGGVCVSAVYRSTGNVADVRVSGVLVDLDHVWDWY